MRRIVLMTAAAVILSNCALRCQPSKKTWEISMSGILGTVSSSSDGYSSSSSEFISLDFRPGFFFSGNLEIEPELQWLAAEHDKPLLSISVNASANFRIPNSTTVPFVLVGYGVTNSIPIIRTLVFRFSDKHDISIINVGGGLKLFATPNVAFRAEYRYQRFHRSESYGGIDHDYFTTYHNIFLGFSLFFKAAS